jgi:AcrR family transcriptional regulator
MADAEQRDLGATTPPFEPVEAARRRRGRPRSPTADRAIAAATIELLASGGLSGLKIEHVAERAGVGKTTIYRRWPTKAQLVAGALEEFVEDFPVPDSGDTRDDVVTALGYQLGLLTAGLGRVAASVLSEAVFHPVLAGSLREPTRRNRELLGGLLARAQERGELHSGVDLELVVDLLWGPVYYRYLRSVIDGEPIAPDYVEAIVDAVWPAIAAERA